jgi:hypothetical protein
MGTEYSDSAVGKTTQETKTGNFTFYQQLLYPRELLVANGVAVAIYSSNFIYIGETRNTSSRL